MHVTVLAVALLALLPAAAGAAPWTAPVQWNAPGDGGVGAASAAVVATPAGDALAMWSSGGGAPVRARWQYANGGFSAVFDPYAGSGVDVANFPKVVAYGDRQAVIAFSGQVTGSDPVGVFARRISDTTPGAVVDVSAGIDTSARTIGVSMTLAGASDGTAVVGLFDADKNQPSAASTAEVRNSRLRVLPAAGPPGPLQLVDTQHDRTELVSTGLPPPNDVLPATAAGTEQPAFWLNAAGKGAVAVRRLVDPDTGTARVYVLRRFDTATGVLGASFTFGGAPDPDPYAIGSSAVTVGPTGDGAVFWSLTGNTTAGGLVAGTALRSWSGSTPGATTTLDAVNWGQTVNAVRDDAGRTIAAWTQRFLANPHATLTVRRLGTDLSELRPNEELGAPTGLLLGLAPAANGARLFSRRLISGVNFGLSDRTLPADGPAGPAETIGPPGTNLTLAAAPMRAADGSLILALRQRGADFNDELWVTRLAAADAGGTSSPPPGGGGGGGGAGAPGTPAPAPGRGSAPALKRVGGGSVTVRRSGPGSVRLTCTAATACTVKLKSAKGRTVLATLAGTVPAGRTAVLKLTLTKAARGRLKRKGRTLALTLTGTVTAAGVSAPVSLKLIVRRI